MNVSGYELEGFGGVTMVNFHVVSDVLSNVTGVRMLTSNTIKEVALYGGRFKNIGHMINGGAGGANTIQDSQIMGMVGLNCKGSYLLAQFNSSCDILGLTADNCAQGGIPGATVFGSIETGGGAADLTKVVGFAI